MPNRFFASVFTTEGEGDIPQFERRAYNTELVDLSITKEGIERILKTLDTSTSPGTDGLHPRPLAEMTEQQRWQCHTSARNISQETIDPSA